MNIPSEVMNHFMCQDNPTKIKFILWKEERSLSYKEIEAMSSIKYAVLKTSIARLKSNGLLLETTEDKTQKVQLIFTEREAISAAVTRFQKQADLESIEQKKYEETENKTRGFELFFEKYCPYLHEDIRKGEKIVELDFVDLAKYEPSLAECLEDSPEECLTSIKSAISNICSIEKSPDVSITNFNIYRKYINKLRSNDINKLVTIHGRVVARSEVRPHVISSRHECPSCGNVIPILQLEARFVEPSRCSCGRKGKFKLLSKELVDAAGWQIEELVEELQHLDFPHRLNVLLKNGFVNCEKYNHCIIGSKVSITGVLKEVPKILKTGGQSTQFDLILEACGYDLLEGHTSDSMNWTASEKEQLNELLLSNDPIDRIAESVFADISGHNSIKKVVLLQQCSGGTIYPSQQRDDLHVLLIGDPGQGKTQLLKTLNRIAPNSHFTSNDASAVGLLGMARKDELLGGFYIEAGLIPRCHFGTVIIDEIEKIPSEMLLKMNDAMESQEHTIIKANVRQKLLTKVKFTCASNPKNERFDISTPIEQQIPLPKTHLDRYDIICIIMDIPNRSRDQSIALKCLSNEIDPTVPKYSDTFVKKYFHNCNSIDPKIPEELHQSIINCYVEIRQSSKTIANETQTKVPTPRALRSLIRLSKAYARSRYHYIVQTKDVADAISLFNLTLNGGFVSDD